jgi:cytochrome c556
MRLFVAIIIFTSLAAVAQESVFPSKEEKKMARILEPQEVNAEVKAFLKLKMKAHNKDMRDLVLAVATLKYDEAKRYAQGIANSPRLADERTPAPAFKIIQDELRKNATDLVTACDKKNPDDLATAFDAMMTTCISCHNAYLVPMRDQKKVAPAPAPAK